jgi:hypothetical protein
LWNARIEAPARNNIAELINSRLAYAAVSRARYDAQIYTNNAEHPGQALSRDVSKDSAISLDHNPGAPNPAWTEIQTSPSYSQNVASSEGLEIG